MHMMPISGGKSIVQKKSCELKQQEKSNGDNVWP
jgi:hypothetical protein